MKNRLVSFCFLVTLVLSLSGCHRSLFLRANAVSMKHRALPENTKLHEIGPVSGRYCIKQTEFNKGEDVGLMDEAIKAAEREHNVDFILHANFYKEHQCVIVEGDGARIN